MLRLDVWLDVACILKTRSEAQRACKGGKVLVNGSHGKAHREVKVGDRVTVTTRNHRKRQLVVTGLSETHLAKSDARTLYEDVTPPPTPEEQELRDLLRRAGPVRTDAGRIRAPDKRARRAQRRLKRAGS